MEGDNNVYKELSYVVNGIFFQVQNELGTNFQEKHYVRAVATLLIKKGIPFELEYPFKVTYNGQFLGKFKADMLIDKKIIVEFKTVPFLNNNHRQQLLRYVKSLNVKLGLLVNFREYPLKIIRIAN
ncbi:MAG: GxxExxY protein [Patescibacteria group bacterium]|nr:GxxExxY protein [Patescibacteria group bacterium]